jgi:signal transduction histidine kinase
MQAKLAPLLLLIPRHLISWKAYWGLLPFSVISTLIFIAPSVKSKTLLLTWLAISLFGHAAMAPFVYYFNGKFDRRTHIIFAMCMGAVRGAVINLTAPILLVTDPLALPVRTMNSSVTVLYASGIAGVLISIWTKFESDLRLVLSNAIESSRRSKSIQVSSSHKVFLQASTNIQQVISDLNAYISSAQGKNDSVPTLKEQANAIDRLINKHIRPHSAERWREAELIWPKIRPLEVLRQSISQTKLPVIATLILALPLSLFGQFANSNFVEGVLTQIASLALILLLVKIAELIAKRSVTQIITRNLVFISAMLVIHVPLLITLSLHLNSNQMSEAHVIQLHISSTLTFLLLTLIGATVMTVQENRENSIELLKEILSEHALSNMIEGGLAASTQSDFAQYLHSEVQSQLMACKLLLLKAAESEFTVMSPEVTQKVLSRLELLKQPYEKQPDRIPFARLQEFRNTWQGLANIEFNLPMELSQVSRNGEIISQLIEELIVNAIRHGKAKNITVSASVSDGRCVISVLDDGRLKSTKKSGLGSTLFEVFAPDWKLVATPQGTLATLTAKYY